MDTSDQESSLTKALRQFEAVEANLAKLERLWEEVQGLIPNGVVFGDDPAYEDRCRSFIAIIEELPKISGWKPEVVPMGLNAIAQNRADALEVAELGCQIGVKEEISAPGQGLREYRYRFNQKRRALVRDALAELIDTIDDHLRTMQKQVPENVDLNESADMEGWDELADKLDQIGTLLGSSVSRPENWDDMSRHIRFRQHVDFRDIVESDWPGVKEDLRRNLYGANEPLPVEIDDLGALVAQKPTGPVPTKLQWDNLSEDVFERLIFALISAEHGYENPEWLMRTNAPDRGRDLSVTRVISDPLDGVKRLRVILQCLPIQLKHVRQMFFSG